MPVSVVTAVASIATVVLPSRLFRSVAAAVLSDTVMVYELSLPVRVVRVDRSPSLIVAVITPLVLPATLLASATLVLPLRVTVSLPRPLMPLEA